MGRLNVRKFSHSLDVRYVTEADFRDIAALCAGNPLYYKYYGSPAPPRKIYAPTLRPCRRIKCIPIILI